MAGHGGRGAELGQRAAELRNRPELPAQPSAATSQTQPCPSRPGDTNAGAQQSRSSSQKIVLRSDWKRGFSGIV